MFEGGKTTYRPDFINKWQTSTFVDMELQFVELCGHPLNKLSTQLTVNNEL